MAGQAGAIFVTLACLLILTFVIGRIMPTDPVRTIAGEDATREAYENVYHQLWLDRPLWQQFTMRLRDVATFDFGTSIRTGQPVLHDVAHALPATIELATFVDIIGAVLGPPMGVAAAVYKGRWPGHVIRVVSLMGHSMPIFWTGWIAVLNVDGGWLAR
ncbi:ABC transporter permease [Salipiger sp. IMCC34102]|uniref:ABC transporter permease n=1 Tax=Salipiger sp. IMCC34102 TaxID=2510647 RepID=UPI001F5C82D3|nr:ABC transporter permease [Salipiger sp. IMCC34102]